LLRFEGHSPRFGLRGTRAYSEKKRESQHLDVLVNGTPLKKRKDFV